MWNKKDEFVEKSPRAITRTVTSESDETLQHSSLGNRRQDSSIDSDDKEYENIFEACSLNFLEDYRTISSEDIERYHGHITSRTIEEAVEILKKAIIEHEGDPCLPSDKLETLQRLVDLNISGNKSYCDEYTLKFEAFLIHDWSIYSEVRSATRPLNEVGENYETFRVYFLGVSWACLGAALDTFFATRFPSINLNAGSILVMLAVSGKLYARLPTMYIPLFKGKKLYINNPGPWTFKEQMLSTLMMKVAVGSPYALRAVISQNNPHFLGIKEAGTFGYIFMMICASNFMGFGLAGIMRQFLVYPTRCVWYNVLPLISVNRVLVSREDRKNVNGWKFKGSEFFGLILFVSFCWYWITNYIFQALSYFDWPAWISPNNVHLQAITGCINGLGLNPLNTLDWNNVGGTAVVTPLFAQLMNTTGAFLSMFALLAIWYTNTDWTAYLPINTTTLYANDGKPYDTKRVLNKTTFMLDEEEYQNYSPPFWSAGILINEGANLLVYTGMIVYATLNYGKSIVYSMKGFGSSFLSTWGNGTNGGLNGYHDRFSRAQRRYKEVPEWWFVGVMFASIGMAIAMIEIYTFTRTPVWTIFFGIGISLLFCVPFGILYATTSISMEINTLFELIIGLALPGNPNALMVSKVFASNFFAQSANYITNQVEAHYTGIAPRILFRAQLVSVMASVLVKSSLTYWVVSPNGIPDLCDPLNKEKFNCLLQRSFFNAAIQWGAIGPRRLFGTMYPALKWCFLAGVFYPIPFWLARKYIPRYTTKFNVVLHGIHEMAILTGVLWAPYSLQYVIVAVYVNVFFNWYIKRKYPMWWQKFTYPFGQAMDVGVAYAGLLIFFATQYKHVVNINWWGNSVPFSVGDARGMPLKPVPGNRGYFGPTKGKLP